ncbi:MAG: GerMN domain-containing protein [Eubacteriales bacterium]|nr:GerMN domain-containing protein [Eubacteriales bacterium]
MKYIKMFIFVLSMVLLTSCGESQEKQKEKTKLKSNEIYVYYVNSDFSDVVKEKEVIEDQSDVVQIADDIMKSYQDFLATERMQSPLPAAMEYMNASYDEKHSKLHVRFQIMYDDVQADALLFAKICVVKTLLQLKDVEKVSIGLTDKANLGEDTATVNEVFDEDSFVMSFNSNNGDTQKGNVILYFANEDGTALKEYHQSIEISNNMSLAALVVEHLIAGPKREGYQAVIPESTTIRNILIKDGICYVDFSDEFYDTENPIRNDIIVYSIVNSLSELPTVSKVQFLKNGEKQAFFRETMPFDSLFERNLDLVEQEENGTEAKKEK